MEKKRPTPKSKDRVKVKKIKVGFQREEQNETERITKENKSLFLKEWIKRRTKVV